MQPKENALLAKLNAAVKSANAAEEGVTTAQAALVSHSRAVGALLLEAKRLHPKVKDFEAFLKKVHGLKLSRAYDLLRLAGGRTTDEELKKDSRERQQKSRANKKKLSRPEPATEPALSVTTNTVAENDDDVSVPSLAAFKRACDATLPWMDAAALAEASKYVLNKEWMRRAA